MTTTTNNKMVNVMTQTDYVYPLGEYPDGCDIPEYISIYDQPKRKIGRPLSKLADEEKVLRMRRLASTNYYEIIEKRRLQQSQNYQRLNMKNYKNNQYYKYCIDVC